MMNSSVEPQGYTNGMLAPSQMGQPAPTLVTLQPVSMPQDDQQQQMSLRVRALLSAFRRRWFVAMFLGLTLSSLAAAGVWYAIPDTYTAYSEMLVDPSNRFLYDARATGEQQVALNVYKQTRIRLAKFPFVLTAALRDPQVAQSRTVKNQPNPIQWLEQNLEISSPGEQFIRVSLTSSQQKDVAPIVNAVVEAFKQEVVDDGQTKTDRRTEELKTHLAVENSELDRLRRELRNLDKDIHTANTAQADKRMEASFLLQVQLRQHQAEIEWEILKTEIELERALEQAARDKAASESAPTGETTETEAVEGTTPAAPEVSDEVIEIVLQKDPEYLRFDEKRLAEERQLKLYEKRFLPSSHWITEKRAAIEKLKRDQDAYREQQTPLIREDLVKLWHEDQQAKLAEAAAALVPGPAGSLVPAGQAVLDPVTALQNSVDRLKATRDRVKQELDAARIKNDDFSTRWVDRELKSEEVNRIKEKVQSLEELVEAREIERAHASSPIEVKRKAEEPQQPDQGKRLKLAGAAGLGLFALVVGGVVLLEYSAHRLNSVSEVQGDLNLQVMSTIPLMPRWVNSESGNTRNKRSEYWHSELTESVDATRTLLLRHAQVSSTKAVMIASATGGEGKTTLSCHLATSLARAGR
ncbi:MAG: hypothetical protein AB7U20_23400, partial [Planctomycetaceae bacterium]